MTSQPARGPLVGLVLKITFGDFIPQITVHSERELTVEILAGEGSAASPILSSIRRSLSAKTW